MSYKGTYRVVNKEKYIGKKDPLYKSGLERSFCIFCDHNPNIIQWQYEGIALPYHNPIKKMINEEREGINAKYFPDFYIKYKNAKGETEEALIEVKMRSETMPPKTPKRQTWQYKRKLYTYAINESKWKQAKKVCDKMGIKFLIITEDFINNHAKCF